MPDRQYKCPLCHSAFRNESGMKWHLAHRHEIPAAFDALGKDYETKIAGLQQENDLLKGKVWKLEMELAETKVAVVQETAENLKAVVQVQQLDSGRQKAIFALVLRDQFIKEKLNIELPNPFAEGK